MGIGLENPSVFCRAIAQAVSIAPDITDISHAIGRPRLLARHTRHARSPTVA
ncbi:hypothetical protein ACFV0L_16745 [Streptosporangium canum]|uniref:hypothetical protein n=1 Tax=Streptosporangium canum TaxID=324952 RepID=UPI00368BF0E6